MRCSSYSETLYEALASQTKITGDDWFPVRGAKNLAHLSSRVLCAFLSFMEIAVVAAPRVALAPCAKLFGKRDFFVINLQVLSAKEAFTLSAYGKEPADSSTPDRQKSERDKLLQTLEKNFFHFVETHQQELATVAVICLVASVYFGSAGSQTSPEALLNRSIDPLPLSEGLPISPSPELPALLETGSSQTSPSSPIFNPFEEVCSVDRDTCGLFHSNVLTRSTSIVVQAPQEMCPLPNKAIVDQIAEAHPAPSIPPATHETQEKLLPPPSPPPAALLKTAAFQQEETIHQVVEKPRPSSETTTVDLSPYIPYFAVFAGGAGLAGLIGVAFCRRGNIHIHVGNNYQYAKEQTERAIAALSPARFNETASIVLTTMTPERVQRYLRRADVQPIRMQAMDDATTTLPKKKRRHRKRNPSTPFSTPLAAKSRSRTHTSPPPEVKLEDEDIVVTAPERDAPSPPLTPGQLPPPVDPPSQVGTPLSVKDSRTHHSADATMASGAPPPVDLPPPPSPYSGPPATLPSPGSMPPPPDPFDDSTGGTASPPPSPPAELAGQDEKETGGSPPPAAHAGLFASITSGDFTLNKVAAERGGQLTPLPTPVPSQGSTAAILRRRIAIQDTPTPNGKSDADSSDEWSD